MNVNIEFYLILRYQSEQPNGQKEGKAIGALFGKNTTTQNRIYPTIKVTGYEVLDNLSHNFNLHLCFSMLMPVRLPLRHTFNHAQ